MPAGVRLPGRRAPQAPECVAGRPGIGDHLRMANTQLVTETTDAKSSVASTPGQRLVTGCMAILGLGFAAAGIAAIFRSESDTGAAALLTVGALIVLFVALGDRLESLRFGDFELRLRQQAHEKRRSGDVEAAKALERAADIVGDRRAGVVRSYQKVRTSMPAGPERTAMMDRIIAEAGKEAYTLDIEQDEVLGLLWTGSEGARVWALGVLQARPEFATPRAVLEAVQRPDQMFDQYQALVLAERFVLLPTTGMWARERIADAVRAQLESGALGDDHPSLDQARRVLSQIDNLIGRRGA